MRTHPDRGDEVHSPRLSVLYLPFREGTPISPAAFPAIEPRQFWGERKQMKGMTALGELSLGGTLVRGSG